MTKLNWKPIRKGRIYCSSACGFDCTYAEFQIATQKAKALAKKMGSDWKPRVWENLGWHYSTISKVGSASVSGSGFTTLYVGGKQFFTTNRKNPVRAYKTLLIEVERFLKKVQVDLAKLPR